MMTPWELLAPIKALHKNNGADRACSDDDDCQFVEHVKHVGKVTLVVCSGVVKSFCRIKVDQEIKVENG